MKCHSNHRWTAIVLVCVIVVGQHLSIGIISNDLFLKDFLSSASCVYVSSIASSLSRSVRSSILVPRYTHSKCHFHFRVGAPPLFKFDIVKGKRTVIDWNIHTNELWMAPSISLLYKHKHFCGFENFGNRVALFYTFLSFDSFSAAKMKHISTFHPLTSGRAAIKMNSSKCFVRLYTTIDHCWPLDARVHVCDQGQSDLILYFFPLLTMETFSESHTNATQKRDAYPVFVFIAHLYCDSHTKSKRPSNSKRSLLKPHISLSVAEWLWCCVLCGIFWGIASSHEQKQSNAGCVLSCKTISLGAVNSVSHTHLFWFPKTILPTPPAVAHRESTQRTDNT